MMRSLVLLLYGMSVLCYDVVLAKTLYRIYHDADYSNHAESAHAIRMGFEAALDDVGGGVNGVQLQVIRKDHRGSSVRSKRHMRQFLDDPAALLMLGGIHSPPYILHREFLNDNSILLLVPWAAGGPITRYSDGLNWVFRVSVDDTKAGHRIGQFSLETLECVRPHLLLESTPWGKSNYRTMSDYLASKSLQHVDVTWFGWGTKLKSAKKILRDVASSDADCVLFVGNAIEGEHFVRAMAQSEEPLPIISHWGITGGAFKDVVTPVERDAAKLHFIQPCFSFLEDSRQELKRSAFNRAKSLNPDRVSTPEAFSAPAGFAHAYDLARILLQAMREVELTGDAARDRVMLRAQLENLKTPVEGLVKTYKQPFSAWSVESTDAHEALGLEDLCMARFSTSGAIELRRD